MNEAKAIDQLLTLVSMLRDKEYGCPWDLEQNIPSLASHTLEEVYEVVDAIETGDMVQLEDELGDLLFQIVFYAQIAAEDGQFNFDNVAQAITRKLLRRHPHVFANGKLDSFGQTKELSSDQVVLNWEEIKKIERAEKLAKGAKTPDTQGDSALADVPLALPGLDRARKLQKRAAGVGFDWPDTAPVLAKVQEELDELQQAMSLASKDEREQGSKEELGDLLFSIVNLSRHMNIDAETALRAANQKFTKRFQSVEQLAKNANKQLASMDLQQMDQLWDQVKSDE